MTGSKMTSMTIEEMKKAREHGESKSDWARLRADQNAGIDPVDDEDSPDASEAMRSVIARRRAGRPVGSDKTQIALRVDNDTLGAFRAIGKGWQSRMNDALRDWLKTHSPT